MMDSLLKFLVDLPKKIILFYIRIYQKTLSPDHGPAKRLFRYGCCRFEPTCSVYSYEAIEKHGLIKGLELSIWRVLRCNPWTKGGADPVPKKR